MTQPPPTDPFAQPPLPGPPAAAGGYAAALGSFAGPPAFVPSQPWGPLAGWGTRVAASLIDAALQLIGLVPYVVGIVLFVIGAPDSRYDSDYSSFEYAPPSDPGSPGLMIAGGVLVVLGLVAMF